MKSVTEYGGASYRLNKIYESVKPDLIDDDNYARIQNCSLKGFATNSVLTIIQFILVMQDNGIIPVTCMVANSNLFTGAIIYKGFNQRIICSGNPQTLIIEVLDQADTLIKVQYILQIVP